MVQVDRAIFSSTEARRSRGYHLIATSKSVSPREARELARWGPSHDSLLSPLGSINYHPLLSGRCCVSKTTAEGAEHSGRGGSRVFTHFMLLSGAQFLEFGNNPFRVIAAAEAENVLNTEVEGPASLPEIELSVESSPPMDRDAIEVVLSKVGGDRLASILNVALGATQLGIVGIDYPEALINALINLIPPGGRPAFSFSTGLRFSNSRPFRLIPIEDDLYQRKLVLRSGRATILDLQQEFPSELVTNHGWARVVKDALCRQSLDELASFYRQLNGLDPEPNLDQSAQQWFELNVHVIPERGEEKPIQQAHAEHAMNLGKRVRSAVAAAPGDRPSAKLDLTRGDLVDELGKLDDAVLDALSGSNKAMEHLRKLWPQVTAKLSPQLIEESRCQYLQFALKAWEAQPGNREAAQAVAVLEMLNFLFTD